MKRVHLHILFWLAYLFQDSLLEFVWIGPALPGLTESQRLATGIAAAATLLIPKMLFTYFMLLVAVKGLLRDSRPLWQIVVESAIALMFSILLYRIIFNYYLDPYMYHGMLKRKPLLDLSHILLAVMDIGFVSGTAVILSLLRSQLAGKEREKSLIKEKLETELKFLRNQINPHFLFNTLNNIYALARKKSDKTAEIVMKLSKLLRFMLYESRKDFIPISEELKMLDDCLELEKIRYNERLTITFLKYIDNDTQFIAPLLLLPFVENAFKHGVSETRFESFIHMVIKLDKGQLTFTIENSKESGESNIVTDNIGLSNVRRQLELMYKDYHLQVDNQPVVFKVVLTINLNSHATI
ncbi:histidine kinase [Chitinophaga niastensis]|uniref:Histidine kinase n=1 Tax=Chitinophaga niastensis TaxID=536980 RepID=A0A2P8HC71_CHINA|nr:sensor histidine kinase [Chitinophaga niastensis]PSL43826.1 histidine kinase [Chitinophaga niastensis]